ncbi:MULTISPECIES: addiction module protein [Nostocaceae]|uniref:addiction module protein n=1 Tax=Nostocaceae TaxID=1162 RepID=UPI001F5531AE|nr:MULTISPECIES: addiction module protein [Nostocaceae]
MTKPQNMSETAEKLKIELSRLSAKERAEIAYFLIHSLDEDIDDNLEITWDTELTQRLEDINCKKAIGEPSSQVFSELREKYS